MMRLHLSTILILTTCALICAGCGVAVLVTLAGRLGS